MLTLEEAKLQERRIKKWRRKWDIELIERFNPDWRDLSKDFNTILTPIEKIDLLFEKR